MEGYDLLVQLKDNITVIENGYANVRHLLSDEQARGMAETILHLKLHTKRAEDLVIIATENRDALYEMEEMVQASSETRRLVRNIVTPLHKKQELKRGMEIRNCILGGIALALLLTGFEAFLEQRFGIPMTRF